MTPFLYFFQGSTAVSDKELAELGLSGSLPGNASRDRFSRGAEAGVLLYVSDEFLNVTDAVQWTCLRDITGDEKHTAIFCGHDPANPPGPEALARPKQQPGHVVTLADGKPYLVPKALAYTPEGQRVIAFPGRVRMAGGQWIKEVTDPVFRDLTERAISFISNLQESSETLVDTDLATKILSVNYRIGPAEVSLLGLYEFPDTLSAIVKAFCDWPGMMEVAKKKASGPC